MENPTTITLSLNLAWLGFWIFLSVLLACDTYLYSQGHNAFFWKHKTQYEKDHRAAQLKILQIKANIKTE